MPKAFAVLYALKLGSFAIIEWNNDVQVSPKHHFSPTCQNH
jgi:hypothetical protein